MNISTVDFQLVVQKLRRESAHARTWARILNRKFCACVNSRRNFWTTNWKSTVCLALSSMMRMLSKYVRTYVHIVHAHSDVALGNHTEVCRLVVTNLRREFAHARNFQFKIPTKSCACAIFRRKFVTTNLQTSVQVGGKTSAVEEVQMLILQLCLLSEGSQKPGTASSAL